MPQLFVAHGVLPKRLQESLFDVFITQGSFPKDVQERERERELKLELEFENFILQEL